MSNFIPSSDNPSAGCAVRTDYPVTRQGDGITAMLMGAMHGLVQRLVERSARRSELRQLNELSDDMLRDIGITRADLYSASQLPLSTDATVHLEVLSKNLGRLY